ncbi:hypothetical protein [Halalkalibacter alkaliphilus]|uniref:Uncharacterized protein n=1 Tax=Halalkalibacter alkaliphilus TaxID=2917993 RepID=A0A9X2I615_9BACI|nr:hypothetical protein [Halalkalibacter alkaliphilus]MCL7748956.1 hypothetical protein [Halalkalibacter alkaliphilus]
MIRAVIFGVFFVFLCVAIPGFLGFYQSSNQTPEQLTEPQSEQQIEEEIETKSKQYDFNEQSKNDEVEDQQLEGDDSSDELVFSNRDEAIEAVLERFSLTELISIFTSVRNGVDEQKRDELVAKLQEQFTDEEIEALKVIGFAELEKVLQ